MNSLISSSLSSLKNIWRGCMSSKAVWRAQILQRRTQIGPQKATELNVELSNNLRSFWAQAAQLAGKNPEALKGSVWAAYRSFKWEANPSEAIAETVGNLRWVYPRVVGKHLQFLEPAQKDAAWV